MPRTIPNKRNHQSLDKQFALAERVLRSIDKSIDEQLERKRDLEVGHALALYKSGKTKIEDMDTVIEEMRRRVG